MGARKWILTVTYPTGQDSYVWGSLDYAIVNAVGKMDSGRGTSIDSRKRDLRFHFSTEKAARAARQRVLNLHRKGVRTSVER